MAESSETPPALPLGIEPADLRRHLYILGGGTWRLDLQLTLAFTLMRRGYGVGILDLKGSASEHFLNAIPPAWVNDTFYWDFENRKYHPSLNLFEHSHADAGPRIADSIVGTFQGFFGTDGVGHRSAYILGGTVLALLEVPGTTLYHVRTVLMNKRYRSFIQTKAKSREVRAFWQYFAELERSRDYGQIMSPLLNKLGAIFFNFRATNPFAQQTSSIDLAHFMQAGIMVCINLCERELGTRQAKLVGDLILSQFNRASQKRRGIQSTKRRDFFLFIPDAHAFSEEVIAPLLSDASSHLNMVIGNQTVGKRRAEFAECGSFLAMKCGTEDVETVVSELATIKFDQRKVMAGMAMAGRPIYGRMYDATFDEFGDAFHSGVDPLSYQRYGMGESIKRQSLNRYYRSRSRVERRLSWFERQWDE